jgi:hypothetical protein
MKGENFFSPGIGEKGYTKSRIFMLIQKVQPFFDPMLPKSLKLKLKLKNVKLLNL